MGGPYPIVGVLQHDALLWLRVQGFRGGTRGLTEWNQWVQSEKEWLAFVMERHGFEWEQKGTHEQHLSVLDYKKQERSKELAAVETSLSEKTEEFRSMEERVNNLESAMKGYVDLERELDTNPDYQLPEPQALMSAKTYKTKFAQPVIDALKSFAKKILVRYFKAMDSYMRVNQANGRLYRENERLARSNDRLTEENAALREENRDYVLLRKVFGSRQIDDLVAQARNAQQNNRRQRHNYYEK